MDGSGQSIRRFLRAHYRGAVATLSAGDGVPYASVVHYACDQQGRPWFLFSDLAVHSHDLAADQRASLLVWEDGPDLMALPRATFLGRIARADPDPALEGRLMTLLPGAESYLDMPDFRFYRLECARVRWIGGFGSMGWLQSETDFLLPVARELELQEAAAVAHMNADHGDALADYWRMASGQTAAAPVRLLALDAEGMDLGCESERLRLDFPSPVATPMQWREQLVAMARQARSPHP